MDEQIDTIVNQQLEKTRKKMERQESDLNEDYPKDLEPERQTASAMDEKSPGDYAPAIESYLEIRR